MVWGFIQSIGRSIAGVAQALLPAAVVMNQGRSLATQSKQMELLQKRDQDNQEIARERMALDDCHGYSATYSTPAVDPYLETPCNDSVSPKNALSGSASD